MNLCYLYLISKAAIRVIDLIKCVRFRALCILTFFLYRNRETVQTRISVLRLLDLAEYIRFVQLKFITAFNNFHLRQLRKKGFPIVFI